MRAMRANVGAAAKDSKESAPALDHSRRRSARVMLKVISPPRRARLPFDIDFAEVSPGLLMPERVGQALERIAGVDDGPNAVGLDGADHRQLMLVAADRESVDANVADHDGRRRDLAGEARQHADERDVSAQPTCGDRLGEGARAADLHDMIDAAPASELAGGLSPVRVIAVVDSVIRSELAQALELGRRGRGGDDASPRGFGEL